jgi:exonuclease III
VGVFIQNELASNTKVGGGFTREMSFLDEIFEAIVIKIPDLIPHDNGRTKNLLLITIYRQPGNNNTDEFLKQTEKWLKLLDKQTNEIVVTGDFNLDLPNTKAISQQLNTLIL